MFRRFILGFVLLLFCVGLGLACGTERWPVKTGTDRDANKVDTTPQQATIAQLPSIAPPINPNVRRNTRYAPTELTVYQVSGMLTVIKVEPDDDYHLVIEDNRRRSMIVESPDPDCAPGSVFF